MIPETPVIDQVPVPVGVCPPDWPVTVAEKVNVDPKPAVGELVKTKTVGVLREILIVSTADVPAEL